MILLAIGPCCGVGSQFSSEENDTTINFTSVFPFYSLYFLKKISVSPDTAIDKPKMETPKAKSKARASFSGCRKSRKESRVEWKWLSVGLFPQTPSQGWGSPPSATSSPTPCPETQREEDPEYVSYRETHTMRMENQAGDRLQELKDLLGPIWANIWLLSTWNVSNRNWDALQL